MTNKTKRYQRVVMQDRDGIAFCDRLQAEMSIHGLTQSDLARAMGVLPIQVSQWACGRVEPKASAVARMLRAMPNADARWLLCGDDETA